MIPAHRKTDHLKTDTEATMKLISKNQDKFDKLFTEMKSKQNFLLDSVSEDSGLHNELTEKNTIFNEAIQKAWDATQKKEPIMHGRSQAQSNAEMVMLQIMTHLNNQPQNQDNGAQTNWALDLNSLVEQLPDEPAYKSLVVALRLASKFLITAVTAAVVGFTLPFVILAAGLTDEPTYLFSKVLVGTGSSALAAVDENRLNRSMGTDMHALKQQLMDLKKSPSEDPNTLNDNAEASSKKSTPG